MTSPERPCASVAWYVAGSLEPSERARFEAHLATCEECLASVEAARTHAAHHARLAATGSAEHVPSALFVRWAEAPASLAADTREWIESHLLACDACREENDLLRAVAASSESVPSSAPHRLPPAETPRFDRAWAWLSSTVLRPAPALAYLVLLAALVPLLWNAPPPHDVPRLSTGEPIVLTTESAVRGDPSTEPTPAEIPAGRGSIRLAIDLPFVPSELTVLDRLVVEWTRDGRIETSIDADPSTGRVISGGTRLEVSLDPGTPRGESVYELRVRAEAPGHPLHDQVLFTRRVKVVR